MKGGLSVNLDDIDIPNSKDKIIEAAQKKVDAIEKSRMRGLITEGERYNKVIDIWTHATNDVKSDLMSTLRTSRDGFNSLHMMIDSGARGSAGPGKPACRYERTYGKTAEKHDRTGR